MFYKPITILCSLCCLLLNLQACATKNLVATSATESQRAMDHQRGIDFLQNEDDHSTYSRNFGNAVARYYGYALSSYGSGYGSAKINNPSSINQNYYASTNKEFSRLDKQKGANRQLHQAEKDFIHNNVEDFREQMSRRGINYTKKDATGLLLLSAAYGTDAYMNGIVNLGLTNFSKSEVLDGLMYLRQKSDGLTFLNYNDYEEFGYKQKLFSATDSQFYLGSNFHQEMQGGLVDMSAMFIPSARVLPEINLGKAVGGAGATRGSTAIIGNTAKGAGTNEAKSIVRISEEAINKGQNSSNIIEKIIQRGEIKPGDHKVMVSKLDDGTIVIMRKDFGKYSHGFPDHYNIEIQVPKGNKNVPIENLHIFPTENGYKWYGKDGVIKGE